jgi:hypothetical protein
MSECCHPPLDVWGLTCNTPNLKPTYAGALRNYFSDTAGVDGNVVLPDVGDPAGGTAAAGDAWEFGAAKVPSSYPYSTCETDPIISSADERLGASEQWTATLTTAGEVIETTNPFTDELQWSYGNIHTAFCSRVWTIDGEQRGVTYAITPDLVTTEGAPDPRPPWNAEKILGDHVQIVIATQVPTVYRVEHGGIPDLGATEMQVAWHHCYPPNNPLEDTYYPENDALSLRAQWHSFGKEFYNVSTYTPGAVDWFAGRQKYVGREIFCTDTPHGTAFDGTKNFTGDYVLVLPAIRVSIDSTAEFDECWWCAMNRLTDDPDNYPNGYANKLVIGQWKPASLGGSDRIRNPGDTSDAQVADGSIQEAEVDTVIVDGSDPPAEFSGEAFKNIEVRCFNRVWDFQAKANRNLLLWTSDPPEGVTTTDSTLVADFEQPDGFNPRYFDHNVDADELQFQSGGNIFPINEWLISASDHHDGSYCAEALYTSDLEGNLDLWIRFTVTTTGSVLKFWYILDNRYSGTRVAPFGELTNFPEVDNNLQVLVDGVGVPTITIDGTLYDYSGLSDIEPGTIDNSQVPSGNPLNDETWYATWRHAEITLSAGARSVRWRLKRKWADDNGHLFARIDGVEFPEIQVGDDINGVRRFFWDGNKVRRAKWWKYPKRDDEQQTDVASRVSTVPDFIALDTLGRIWYGNPHYVVVLVYDADADEWSPDETFCQKGFFVCTASPEIQPPDEVQNADCEWVAVTVGRTFDTIKDPQWGAMQILQIEGGGAQLRGMNGQWRDASHNPLSTKNYPDETFIRVLNADAAANWNSRCQGWTISSDGKTRVPHVEVIWRCNFDQPSWPFAPPYTNAGGDPGPWHSRTEDDSYLLANNPGVPFPDAGYGDYLDPNFARIRDPRKAPLAGPTDDDDDGDDWTGSRKPQWVNKCKIVSRVYCDSYSRKPQFIWTENPSPDPPETINEGADPNPDFYTPPWPRSQALMVPAYHCPTGGHSDLPIAVLTQKCSQDDDPLSDHDADNANNWHYNFDYDPVHGGFTDFDAVFESGCDCCQDAVLERVDRSA